jgi:hypothetical protein
LRGDREEAKAGRKVGAVVDGRLNVLPLYVLPSLTYLNILDFQCLVWDTDSRDLQHMTTVPESTISSIFIDDNINNSETPYAINSTVLIKLAINQ